MSYKVEISDTDHQRTLLATLADWARQEHDIYLVSTEGHKLFSQKVLLSFYSPVLREVLHGLMTSSCPGISVPATSSTLSSLLELLLHGRTRSPGQQVCNPVREAAAALGINLNNCVVENRRKPNSALTVIKLPLKPETKPVKTVQPGSAVLGPVIKRAPISKPVSVRRLDGIQQKDPVSTSTSANLSVFRGRIASSDSYQWKPVKEIFNREEVVKSPLNENVSVRVKTEKDVERPDIVYPCDQCGNKFNSKKYLQRHRLREHGMRGNRGRISEHKSTTSEKKIPVEKTQVKDELLHKVEIDSNGKDVNCNECGKVLINNAALKAHMNIHLAERPFKCTICDKGFNQKGNLKVHLQKHHGKENVSNSDIITNTTINLTVNPESRTENVAILEETIVLGQNVEVLETDNSDVLADEVTEDKNPLLDESAENNELEEFNNESFLKETA